MWVFEFVFFLGGGGGRCFGWGSGDALVEGCFFFFFFMVFVGGAFRMYLLLWGFIPEVKSVEHIGKAWPLASLSYF